LAKVMFRYGNDCPDLGNPVPRAQAEALAAAPAGAGRERQCFAATRLEERLDDPGPGGFRFTNRPEARRILQLLRKRASP
jgi:hypothetical protein